MTRDRMLDWGWRLAVLALLAFCALRLETLQGQPQGGSAIAGGAVMTMSDQLLKEQDERHALLRAARKAAGQPENLAHHHP